MPLLAEINWYEVDQLDLEHLPSGEGGREVTKKFLILQRRKLICCPEPLELPCGFPYGIYAAAGRLIAERDGTAVLQGILLVLSH